MEYRFALKYLLMENDSDYIADYKADLEKRRLILELQKKAFEKIIQQLNYTPEINVRFENSKKKN